MPSFGGGTPGNSPIAVKFGKSDATDHQFTGSVYVSGSVYAMEYNVDSVTTTIVNIDQSGSTKFGNSADDTHQFSGSLHVADDAKIYFGANNDASIEYDEDGTDELIISGAVGGIDILMPRGVTDAFTLSDATGVYFNANSSGGSMQFNKSLYMYDDTKLYFGSGGDASIEYDEDGTNELRFAGAATTFEQAVTFDANVTLGNAATDIITTTGQLTASQGIASTLPSYFNDNVTFGTQAGHIITATGQLTASEGIASTGRAFFNSHVALGNAAADVITVTGQLTASQGLAATVPTGTLAGQGSYIGLNTNNQFVLTSSGGATINNATENEIVTVAANVSELDAEANLTFDGSTLRLKGFMSSPVGVFNSSSIDDTVTLPSNYRCLLYGPITIGSQGEFTIGSDSSVKIKSWDDV
tara:strand:+ start:1475 stop:2716 length:1242 start_codon:yes stop_codon:yes gene_type:complete